MRISNGTRRIILTVSAVLMLFSGMAQAGDKADQSISLKLESAVELAVEQNVELALTKAEVEAARVNLEQVRAQSLVKPSPTMLRQAETALDIAQRNLALAEQDLVLQVEEAYYDVLRLKNLLTVLDEARSSAKRQLEVSVNRRNAGVATEIDVLRAQNSLAKIEVDRSQALDNLNLTLLKLKQTLALPATAKLSLDETVVTSEPVAMSLEEATKEGLANRVEMAQGRVAIEVARKEVELSTNDYTPELTLAKAKVEAEKASLRLHQIQNGIALDVQSKYNRVQDTYRRLNLTQQQLIEAQENLRVVNAMFEVGAATDLEVLGAQTKLTEARTAAVNAVYDYNVARAEFFKSIAWGLSKRSNENEGAAQ